MSNYKTFLLLSLSTALMCCSTDSEDGTADPESGAPVISALAFAPDEVPVVEQTIIEATMQFTDKDGDLVQQGLMFTLPNGMAQAPQFVPIAAAEGRTAGPVVFSFYLNPPTAGDYTIDVWLVDAAGNESNRLQGVVNAL